MTTWSHNSSNQLLKLLDRVPENLIDEVRASIARDVAQEHGRSTYASQVKT
jgi:hypothetical protein